MSQASLTREITIELTGRKVGQDGRAVYPATLSTGAAVVRRSWTDGEYEEVLEISERAIDLSRSPFPLIISHDGAALPVGIVDNARVVNGKLRGDITFGVSPRAREIEPDVAGGIIRNLSIGYRHLETTERPASKGRLKTITATRWAPYEVSLVAMGADAGAGIGRNHTMSAETNEETREGPELIERTRCAAINTMGRKLGIDATLIDRLIRDGTSLDEARAACIDAYERARPPIVSDAGRVDPVRPGYGGAYITSSGDAGEDFRSAASDALLLRAGLALPDAHPAARDISGSVHEIARTCLGRAGRTVRTGPENLIRGAMTTGDFPLILADALHKATRRGYEDEPASHREWVRPVPVADFRDQHRPILGSAPELEQVAEHGEYRNGALDEDSTSYRVAKYGKIVSLSWESLVNDNLSAFLRIQPSMGQAARRKEADVVYALFAENGGTGPVMQDSVVLFHEDHGNVTATGTLTNMLASARALLRKQQAVGGGYLSLVPRHLVIPVEKETEAELLLARATRNQTVTSLEGMTPDWIARLQLVVEPRLASTASFLAADTAQIDTVELGLLEENQDGPFIEQEQEFRSDIYRWKIRHVFGAKCLDWRGLIKIPHDS